MLIAMSLNLESSSDVFQDFLKMGEKKKPVYLKPFNVIHYQSLDSVFFLSFKLISNTVSITKMKPSMFL